MRNDDAVNQEWRDFISILSTKCFLLPPRAGVREDDVVRRMAWPQGACQKLGAQEVQLGADGEDLSLLIKILPSRG